MKRNKKGSGWYNDRPQHRLAGKGIKTAYGMGYQEDEVKQKNVELNIDEFSLGRGEKLSIADMVTEYNYFVAPYFGNNIHFRPSDDGIIVEGDEHWVDLLIYDDEILNNIQMIFSKLADELKENYDEYSDSWSENGYFTLDMGKFNSGKDELTDEQVADELNHLIHPNQYPGIKFSSGKYNDGKIIVHEDEDADMVFMDEFLQGISSIRSMAHMIDDLHTELNKVRMEDR